jgi:hypothetical protein
MKKHMKEVADRRGTVLCLVFAFVNMMHLNLCMMSLVLVGPWKMNECIMVILLYMFAYMKGQSVFDCQIVIVTV